LKKLTEMMKKYGVREKEMLSVIESLKEFWTTILGYPIDIYTDQHVSKCKHIKMEDYAPTIQYIKGEKNIVADTLSWNPIDDSINADEDNDEDNYILSEECWDLSNWRRHSQLITLKSISKEQKKDNYTWQLIS
jgi:hypothetical protein